MPKCSKNGCERPRSSPTVKQAATPYIAGLFRSIERGRMQIAWWEFLGTCLGLAICGLVLRRAIKRMPSEHREATKDL